MNRVVFKLGFHDDKYKKKVLKVASSHSGVDSISMDMKDMKMTVTGDIDPVWLVSKLRKLCTVEILSIRPQKVAEKKKEDNKKDPKDNLDELLKGRRKKEDNTDILSVGPPKAAEKKEEPKEAKKEDKKKDPKDNLDELLKKKGRRKKKEDNTDILSVEPPKAAEEKKEDNTDILSVEPPKAAEEKKEEPKEAKKEDKKKDPKDNLDELLKFKETVSTVETVLQDLEQSVISEDLESWLEQLDVVLKDASELLHEIELWSQGSAFQKLCRFFNPSNPLVHRIKKMREPIDEIAAVRERVNLVSKQKNVNLVRRHVVPATSVRIFKKIRERVSEMISRIEKLNDNVTYSFFPASGVIGKQIVYEVACIVAVCMDPFFLYIPFLSHTKMCLGMNRVLWKVAVALRTVADFFTALILLPQLSRCMSSIKSILLMCVKFLALAPIPQILFSEEFILKTLRGYTFWNLSLFCQYGIRLALIFQSCEQLKKMESTRTLALFYAPIYLFLYLIVSHVIGASWYHLSIKRQLSCWNYACKINTGCIFHCDGTTTSTLNSTLYNQFCPINPPNATVFHYGIYLDALQSPIVEEEGVLKKCLRCFFWGLRNLSSFGSNLHTSTNDGETFFAIIISAVALILLIYIIGNIQRYTELESARWERIVYKMELIKELIECLVVFHNLDNCTKKSIVEHIQEAFENGYKSFNSERLRISHFLNDVTKTESVLKDLRLLEEWVFNAQPDNLGKAKKWLSDNNIRHDQNNILLYLTCRLKVDEDVNLTSVLFVLPEESKWMTMKDLCFDTLKEVPGLQKIDEEWFKSMSSILKPVIYPKGCYIFRQGEPLHLILFIANGVAERITWQPLASGGTCTNVSRLRKGKFFGGELIKWKLESPFFRVPGISKSLQKGNLPEEELVRLLEIGSVFAPISTADIKSLTQIEAFVLTFEDLVLSSDFPVERRKCQFSD